MVEILAVIAWPIVAIVALFMLSRSINRAFAFQEIILSEPLYGSFAHEINQTVFEKLRWKCGTKLEDDEGNQATIVQISPKKVA